MPPLARTLGRTVFVFALLFGAFFLFLSAVRRPETPRWARIEAGEQSRPVTAALTHATSSFVYYAREFFTLQKKSERRKIEARVQELEEENRTMKEIAAENDRLRQILQYRSTATFSMSLARVVNRDPSNWTHMIILDQGSEEGVSKGMAVLCPDGIVGKVQDVFAHTARVMVLLDPSCRISGLIKRSRVVGVVTGLGNGMLQMEYLSGEDDVQIGDAIVSAGEGRVFPKGRLIGIVEKVKRQQEGLSLQVLVKPSVDIKKLEEAAIVRNIE